MDTILLTPPIAFMILLGLSFMISMFSKMIASKGVHSAAKTNAYACGEDMEDNLGRPDYSEFFKFAFFFTIMHVIVLIVATDPVGISYMSATYLAVTVLALFMLFRR